jgi:hypothetical protein
MLFLIEFVLIVGSGIAVAIKEPPGSDDDFEVKQPTIELFNP